MNNKTLDYYNQNAGEFINRTVDADMHYCQDKFIKLLKPGAYILDAGCGSGRDSLYFIEHGFKVCAFDGSEEMCKAASEYIGQPVECMMFQDIDYKDMFDGMWACASLLHLPKRELPDVLRRLYIALKPGGIMYASFKYGDKEEERSGRFFSDYRLEEVEKVFVEDAGFELIDGFETEDVRPDYAEKPWVNVVVRKMCNNYFSDEENSSSNENIISEKRDLIKGTLNIASPVVSGISSALSLVSPGFIAIPIVTSVINELCTFYDTKSVEKRLLEFERKINEAEIDIRDFREKIDYLSEHSRYVFRNNLKHLCLEALPETTDTLINCMISYLVGETQEMDEELCEIICADIKLMKYIKDYLTQGDRKHYNKMLDKAYSDFKEQQFSKNENGSKYYNRVGLVDRNIIYGTNTIFLERFY